MKLTPEIRQAANHIRSHAQGYRAVLTIVDAISQVEDLERMAGEADALLSKKAVELSDLKADIEVARSDLGDLKSKADAQKTANAEALASARDKAEGIVAEARAKAEGMVSDAKADAQAKASEAADRLAEVEADIRAAQQNLRTAQAELERLSSEADAAEKRKTDAISFIEGLARGPGK